MVLDVNSPFLGVSFPARFVGENQNVLYPKKIVNYIHTWVCFKNVDEGETAHINDGGCSPAYISQPR